MFQILQGPHGLSVHWNLSWRFRSLKNGSPLSRSREMNLFRGAMHPVSFCTSLIVARASISVMAVIFTGLATIPQLMIINPSNFPDGTPKTHLVGLCNNLM
jgi:hypothetical protein